MAPIYVSISLLLISNDNGINWTENLYHPLYISNYAVDNISHNYNKGQRSSYYTVKLFRDPKNILWVWLAGDNYGIYYFIT